MALRLAGRKYEVLLFAFVVVLLISGPLYIGRYVGSLGVGQAEELTLTVDVLNATDVVRVFGESLSTTTSGEEDGEDGDQSGLEASSNATLMDGAKTFGFHLPLFSEIFNLRKKLQARRQEESARLGSPQPASDLQVGALLQEPSGHLHHESRPRRDSGLVGGTRRFPGSFFALSATPPSSLAPETLRRLLVSFEVDGPEVPTYQTESEVVGPRDPRNPLRLS